VDEAFAAGALLVLKRAFVQPHEGVFLEFFAFWAEFAVGSMVPFAVDVNHVGDGFLFPFHSFVFWVWRLRLHFKSALEIACAPQIRVYPKR